MSRQPLLIFAICFIAGIAAQELFSFQVAELYAFAAVAAVSLLCSFVRKISFQRLKPYFFGIICAVLGMLLHFQNSRKPALPKIDGREEIVFHLDKKLNSNEKNRRYEITFRHDDREIKAVISVPREFPELDFAHWYKGEFRIGELKSPENDFQFDYAKYLSRKDIYFQGYLSGSLSVADRKDLSFSERIRQNRSEVLQKINETEISARSREFMKGIILADRTEMDSQTVQDFSKTGLVHILAISGTHIVIIFGIFFLIFKTIFPAKIQKGALISSLLLIWAFAAYIGFGSSVVRACVMIITFYGFKILQRKTDGLHAMALAAFCILLSDTQQLFEVGFQLSFLAVLGIFWLNKPLLEFLPKPRNNFQKWLVNIPTITVSAQMMTLPLVLYYFHQFSAVSFIANLVIIPFSELFIIGSLLSTVLIGLGVDIKILQIIYDFLVQNLLDVIHRFAVLDAGFSENIAMHWTETVILLIIIFLTGLYLRFRKPKTSLLLACAVAVFFSLRFGMDYNYGKQSEEMVHAHYSQKIVSVKTGKQVVFFIPENADEKKLRKYLINPYLTSRRTKHCEIQKLPKNVSSVTWNGKTVDLSR